MPETPFQRIVAAAMLISAALLIFLVVRETTRSDEPQAAATVAEVTNNTPPATTQEAPEEEPPAEETTAPPPATTAPEEEVTVPPPATTAPEEEVTVPPPATTAPAPAQALTRLLLVASGGDSWLDVRAGSAQGEVLYAGILAQGGEVDVKAKQLWVRFGAASHLTARLNGKPLPLGPGTYNAVISPDGLQLAPE